MFERILNFILQIIVIPIYLIYLFFSLIWKFLKDVTKSLYGKIVAIVATGIIAYMLFHFFGIEVFF